MRNLTAVLLVAALLAVAPAGAAPQPGETLISEGIPEVPEELAAAVARYQNARSAYLFDWHPSERRMLVGTRFADTVGISNFVTFLENTKPYRVDNRRVEYGDERDPEMRAFLEEISPANRANRIQVPLFVSQGANDPRVPASEAEQIVEQVRQGGQTVWYLLATDEGHGFRKKPNRDHMTNVTTLFLQTFLLGDEE